VALTVAMVVVGILLLAPGACTIFMVASIYAGNLEGLIETLTSSDPINRMFLWISAGSLCISAIGVVLIWRAVRHIPARRR